ncbi:MAG TPA: BPL-N domain-containing protein [Amoebophilaceae bacterium]|nr:BPL-N domain-containing protein [Amoebophilaceae bacterium]
MKQPSVLYLYHDDGVGVQSLWQIKRCLQKMLSQHYTIQTLNAQAVAQGAWCAQAALFVIPGGADLPYLRRLSGRANQYIKQYVEQGGVYWGFCAGAYYASEEVKFDQGGPLEVVGKRPLAFFPGVAVGPLFGDYSYHQNRSACCARIKGLYIPDTEAFDVFYNGGSYFLNATDYPNVEVVAYYQMLTLQLLPAILSIRVGRGRALLSGVHIEYDPHDFSSDDVYLMQLKEKLTASDLQRQQLLNYLFNVCSFEIR